MSLGRLYICTLEANMLLKTSCVLPVHLSFGDWLKGLFVNAPELL